MKTQSPFQKALEEAAAQFQTAVMEAVRTATLEDLMAMYGTPPSQPAKRRGRPRKSAQLPEPAGDQPPAAPKRRGRPPKKKAEPAVAEAPADKPTKKARKKRDWPTCSVEDCKKNVYMPSGANKMCYAHHVEAGG